MKRMIKHSLFLVALSMSLVGLQHAGAFSATLIHHKSTIAKTVGAAGLVFGGYRLYQLPKVKEHVDFAGNSLLQLSFLEFLLFIKPFQIQAEWLSESPWDKQLALSCAGASAFSGWMFWKGWKRLRDIPQESLETYSELKPYDASIRAFLRTARPHLERSVDPQNIPTLLLVGTQKDNNLKIARVIARHLGLPFVEQDIAKARELAGYARKSAGVVFTRNIDNTPFDAVQVYDAGNKGPQDIASQSVVISVGDRPLLQLQPAAGGQAQPFSGKQELQSRVQDYLQAIPIMKLEACNIESENDKKLIQEFIENCKTEPRKTDHFLLNGGKQAMQSVAAAIAHGLGVPLVIDDRERAEQLALLSPLRFVIDYRVDPDNSSSMRVNICEPIVQNASSAEIASRNHYAILGLTKNASTDAIKKAFRRLSMQYHPDKNPGNPEAEAKFKEIQGAYGALQQALGFK